jgi:hypothetical protein
MVLKKMNHFVDVYNCADIFIDQKKWEESNGKSECLLEFYVCGCLELRKPVSRRLLCFSLAKNSSQNIRSNANSIDLNNEAFRKYDVKGISAVSILLNNFSCVQTVFVDSANRFMLDKTSEKFIVLQNE